MCKKERATLVKSPRKMAHYEGNNFEATASIINWDIWQTSWPQVCVSFHLFS